LGLLSASVLATCVLIAVNSVEYLADVLRNGPRADSRTHVVGGTAGGTALGRVGTTQTGAGLASVAHADVASRL
jgi:hypothetical protein